MGEAVTDLRTSNRMRPSPSSRRGEDRGAVAVEAAILIPVLVLLALGMMELGLLMRAHTATTTLAREGARSASAASRVPSFADDAANAIARSATTMDFERMTVWVYLVRPGDSGEPPATCTTNCRSFSGWVDPSGTTPGYFSTVSPVTNWNASTINACLRDPQAESVGVWVQTSHDYLFQVFPDQIPTLAGSNTNVRSRTVMKFEPVIPRSDAAEVNLRSCK